jgi:aldoxime dehydratase
MEPAIPKHLDCSRTRARRIAEDYQPPYPAWVARFPLRAKQMVMAYFGVQSRGADPRPFLEWIAQQLSRPGGPGHWDRARYRDEAGYDTVISIAYWDDPRAFDEWMGRPEFRAWWESDARLAEPFGYFREIVRPRIERFETLFSTPDKAEGVAALAECMSGEVQEHAYWGGARDRIPLSQTDPMEPAGAPEVLPAKGGRIRVRPHENLCLIRSGQDWSETAGEERRMYLGEMEPVLREGMHYLRDQGLPIGCYCCRYMRVVDEAGCDTEKSFGMSYFRSLGELERWAESHPTHVAIFGTFMRIVQQLDFQLKLRLYHEVTVARADEQFFEYLNCHPQTGMLRGCAVPAETRRLHAHPQY